MRRPFFASFGELYDSFRNDQVIVFKLWYFESFEKLCGIWFEIFNVNVAFDFNP